MKLFLLVANSVILAASFYFFKILTHHEPSGNESLAILLYVAGLIVGVMDIFFVFRKRERESKGISPLNIIFLLLVFDHLVVNLAMFVLVMTLMQL